MEYFVFAIIVIFFFLILRKGMQSFNPKWEKPANPLSKEDIDFLLHHISFYQKLKESDKTVFKFKVNEFIQNVTVTGVDCRVDRADRLLIAASAVIPIFSFPDWQYLNLDEVLLYPRSFNTTFETEQRDSAILGMVGSGPMEGKMILSRSALKSGFANEKDGRNTAIHEFVHLIDKMDGTIDGIPQLLLEKQYTLPWLALIDEHIQKIRNRKSSFNPYAGTNREEFLAELSVYFFEKPEKLKLDHPKLYKMLDHIFNKRLPKKGKLPRKKNANI